MIKTASIFGYKNIQLTESEIEEMERVFEYLIVVENVRIFLFGSCSDFNSICHNIVSQLKVKYPYIQIKRYTRIGIEFPLENKLYLKKEIYSNMEINLAMINDSDLCVFYYNENDYPIKKYPYNSITYQSKTDVAFALYYAEQKQKKILNICGYLAYIKK